MEERINVSEILRNCPKGMELDCTCADNVVFEKIIEYEQIKCVIGESRDPLILDKYGRLIHICCPKCVIFPKGKTSWEGFEPLCKFKDGDVLFVDSSDGEEDESYQYIFILNKPEFYGKWHSYCFLDRCGRFESKETYLTESQYHPRFATEEEKQKLFDAIKANGYKWNKETKTLEKLITPKFDINTLVPFESRVLVRDTKEGIWRPAIWGGYVGKANSYHCVLGGMCWKCCVPYEGNEHLIGKTDDCADYFKTW